jgi:pimeloyl-ACP methyl ester carboxylesterase
VRAGELMRPHMRLGKGWPDFDGDRCRVPGMAATPGRSRLGDMNETFVLVHGAWHGSWCWDKVAPLLERRGRHVETPDLPGRGADHAQAASLTLKDYVDRVGDVVAAQSGPVVLVGHSLGGIVITQLAEEMPDRVQALVYLAAFLPKCGQSLIELAQQDSESQLGPNLVIREDQGDHIVRPEAVRDIFYPDCGDDEAARAIARLVPEPLAPVMTPVHTTDQRFGRIPRLYLTTLRDLAISPAQQRRMYTLLPCQAVIPMDTGHSPFLSAPEDLASNLVGSLTSAGVLAATLEA